MKKLQWEIVVIKGDFLDCIPFVSKSEAKKAGLEYKKDGYFVTLQANDGDEIIDETIEGL